MKITRNLALSLIIIAVISIAGFFVYQYSQPQPKQSLILSTTTSTFDSGLLDYLLPIFENKYNAKVSVLSKGTGESIAIAQRGDADVVLVHTRSLEEAFINSTYGVHRVGIMYNDFIVIGPTTDPAGIKGMNNATKVFSLIMEAGKQGKTVFISRADKSGTNTKELEIWAKLGITPTNRTASWYIEAGAGMGTVLRMANEKKAYTLTDRATWLSFKTQLTNLALLVEKDKAALLLNPYAVILVNPEKYPQRNYKTALAFAKFMASEEGQKLIENFQKEGETLFFPMARDISKANQLGFPNQAQEIAWYDSQQLL